MDFDLDDPLGDLLSDGSNDSFFDTSKQKNSTAKATAPTASDTKSKSKVADLFGFDTTISNEKNLKSNQLDLNAASKEIIVKRPVKEEGILNSTAVRRSSIKRSTPERSVQQSNNTITETITSTANIQKKETRFDDSDDFLNELGFDPKYPKGNIGTMKKSNILHDILNFSKDEQIAKTTNIASTPKPTTNDSNDRIGSRPTDTNTNINLTSNRYSPSSRRSRNIPRSASGNSDDDPLGFFSSSSIQTQEIKKDEIISTTSTKSKPTKKLTVDWLGLDTDSDAKSKEMPISVTAEPIHTKTETSKSQDLVINTKNTVVTDNPSLVIPQTVTLPIVTNTLTTDNISANLNMVNLASLENEKTVHSLQQQEIQLRIATQMKEQESKLHDIHLKQETLLKQQENQFNELFRRQFDRQNQLDMQIQRQQEYINAYINVLMNQPTIGLKEQIDTKKNEEQESHQNVIELEADVKRLELEKLRLEDILQNVQSAHEQELELLHISHKKQKLLLEESIESLEKRLREELKSTETYYLDKISVLQSHMEQQQHKYEENVQKLINDYEKQIEKLRLGFEQDLEALQNDQRSIIENIRQAKLYEFATLQESGSYLSTLKSASDQLHHATGNLESMRTNISSTIERIHEEREIQLNSKEQRLNEQQKCIEKTIEKTEEERTRLIELVKSLEIKLNSVEQSSTEEQWNMRQKSAALEAERVSFEREKTFTREKLAEETKRIEEMKEMQLSEHKRLMAILDSEREQILLEKAKLETMERLKMSSNSTTKRHSELDAAIKIAQDAAKSADIERENFIELKRKHELKKRELAEKEIMLQTQQNELDLRLSEAKDQKQIAEHATKTCKALEQKLLAKLQNLQTNYMELTEREAKLAQTKMALGKERIELQQMRQQLRQSKCSLCRIGIKNTEISDLDPLNDISTNDRPIHKFKLFSPNSFDGLQQRLSNMEAMIDDVIINVPTSPKFDMNSDLTNNTNLQSKTIILDPF